MSKLRVWWIPQVGMNKTFYVPVNTPESGKRVMDILAAYDMFLLENNIKPDYCNMGGLQVYDEHEKEWVDWCLETEDDYYDTVDEYCESPICDQMEELEEFSRELFSQISSM